MSGILSTAGGLPSSLCHSVIAKQNNSNLNKTENDFTNRRSRAVIGMLKQLHISSSKEHLVVIIDTAEC